MDMRLNAPQFCPRPTDALFGECPSDPDVAELCRLVVRFFQRLATTVDGAEFISQYPHRSATPLCCRMPFALLRLFCSVLP